LGLYPGERKHCQGRDRLVRERRCGALTCAFPPGLAAFLAEKAVLGRVPLRGERSNIHGL